MEGDRHRALAAFLEPRRAVAARRPHPAPFPSRIGIVDAAVQALGIEAQADRARAARPICRRPARAARRSRCRSRSARRCRGPACCADRPRCNSSPRRCSCRCRQSPAPDTGRGSSPRGHWSPVASGPFSGPLHLRRSKLAEMAAAERHPHHALAVDIGAARPEAGLRDVVDLGERGLRRVRRRDRAAPRRPCRRTRRPCPTPSRRPGSA